MPINELFLEGVNLMILGMGMVFTFLAVLVLLMIGMSRVAQALGGDEQPSESTTSAKSANTSDDSEIIAVISAAISRFRSSKK